MKSLRSLLLGAAVALAVTTQAAPPAGWSDDYAKAAEKAKAENKNLLLDFTGSDWCGYCMALDKEVFSTAKFKTWAKDNVVLVQVDFPQGKHLSKKIKDQNDGLKKQFGASGYPTVIVASPDGKELARKVGYSPKSGPDAYLEALTAKLTKNTAAAQ